jgi:ATP-dependent protease HslVU (ClpYQ) peptidase subunit
MTCIAGIAEKGSVWIGGDSLSTCGLSAVVRASPKVFSVGDDLIFGCCGSPRMCQLLEHSFRPPDHDPRTPVIKHMVTAFVDAVRSCFKDGGHARREYEEEFFCDSFLCGYKGRLFTFYADYQISESVDGPDNGTKIAAIGSGADLALGALAVLDVKLPPEERLVRALAAAEQYNAGVRRPFVVEELAA